MRHFFAPGNGQEQAVQTRSCNEASTTTVGATIETHTITTSAATATSITLGTTTTNARTGGFSPFPPHVPLLYPLQLLLVGHEHGYREFQKGGQVCLPLKMLIQVIVIFMHPFPHLRKSTRKFG